MQCPKECDCMLKSRGMEANATPITHFKHMAQADCKKTYLMVAEIEEKQGIQINNTKLQTLNSGQQLTHTPIVTLVHVLSLAAPANSALCL